ncbi:Gfo/Idh/MocA family protein [Roseisolibacter agri]|uniref:Gfo/Idh/MocA family protein n=1 Tax=Roseisolibacter agri TaxID=2014610 RepID=UPI0024E113E5|nr:Gfo/Idh/MocA family oxidoreductase [Roseisolibacter agri]
MSAPTPDPMMTRRLRYGMVGGGPGAFIGAVHRRAASLDGLAELVAGAFSSDAARSRAQGAELGLDPRRVYASFEEMAAREAELPEGERIDFVAIVTPNHMHYANARAFVERGIHVVCDKPLTTTLEDAEALCRLVAERDVVFALTHPYAAYPLVKQARALVASGALGVVRKVIVEYSQGWLATAIEETGNRQADWRTDPARAGAGAIGDIGTHAEHLARYVTGLEIERLYADVSTFVPGRRIDDDANMLVHYRGGAKGILVCSQISVGEENRLALRVYGTDASLEWHQQTPNELLVRRADGPTERFTPGHAFLVPEARRGTRMPPGHPEGLLEAFANIYANVARVIMARRAGVAPDPLDLDFPTVQDGAAGVHFVHAALASGRTHAWVDAAYTPPTAGTGATR